MTLVPFLSGPYSQSIQSQWESRLAEGFNNMYGKRNRGGRAVSTAKRLRTGRSYTKTRTTRRRQIAPRMNSFQNDVAPRYAYKRMPSYRRRKWVNAVKRNLHMDMAQQPLQIATTTSVRERTATYDQGGNWSKMCGGTTWSGVAFDTNDEILNVFQDAYNLTGATVADIVAACLPYKIQIKSIVLDVQIKNVAEDACIVDVYLLKCRARHNESQAVHTQFSEALNDLTAVARSGATQISATNPVVTAFDAPDFCSIWKVLRKTEVIIAPGQTVTKQIRSPGNRMIDGRRLTDCPQCLPGTLALFFTFHGAPSSDADGAGNPGIAASSLVFTSQTVVHYATPPGSLTKEAGAEHV